MSAANASYSSQNLAVGILRNEVMHCGSAARITLKLFDFIFSHYLYFNYFLFGVSSDTMKNEEV